MLINPNTQRPSDRCLLETMIVPVVPNVPEELSKILNVILERLLHPQFTVQVFSDTFFLSSLTREYLAEEKSAPLAYAQRRLAVFELGLQAMLVCSDFEPEERNCLFEKIVREREAWDNRVWELLLESGEYRHHPIGFYKQKCETASA
jgi:hypothetical protein